jgi:chemotaxis protein MotB
MGAQSNLAPVIIKRKRKVAGGAHHGGAWKVAYADFVTAMMAFFMMMWLLNATTEQQRKGLADYFAPTIPVNRVSGGGDGTFGGESVFSEETLPQNGLGATTEYATRDQAARGDTGNDTDGESASSDADFEALVEELLGRGGESHVMENLLEHIVTRITDEGLVIEVFALEGLPLFEENTDVPTELMTKLVNLVSSVAATVNNEIAIGGHVRSKPIVVAENPVWDKSASRATRTRVMMETAGIEAQRMHRVTGHADREPVHENPMVMRNNRVEIILLRK